MILFDAPVHPDALTAFVREVPIEQNLNLLNLFPAEYLDTNTVDFAEIVRRNRTAQFRSFDGSIHVTERDAGSEKRVRLMPLSDSLNETEYERLQRQFAQTGGTNVSALERAIYNDAENLTRYMLNRMQLAWGQLISNQGALTINESGNGLKGFTADFGVPAAHKVTPAVAWSDHDNAKVITDLTIWHDEYKKLAGPAGAVRMDTVTLRHVLRNKEVIDDLYGATQGKTRAKLSDLNDYLREESLPVIQETTDSQVEVDGVATPVIEPGTVWFAPANIRELGYTAWGVTATALELVEAQESELEFGDASGIVGVIDKIGPPYRKFTFVDAVALPILSNAKKLLVAKVL
ncbi:MULTISPECIES: major capsid protein [unclassified Aeromicrobium]|uniref:major capsid protein n=1 Tax=unclassified Aeromicrobium TaxID=2633570 RepID=UPI00288AE8A5|nr:MULTISPECIES: major capsid protein [unclassified Aeromicrobium]